MMKDKCGNCRCSIMMSALQLIGKLRFRFEHLSYHYKKLCILFLTSYCIDLLNSRWQYLTSKSGQHSANIANFLINSKLITLVISSEIQTNKIRWFIIHLLLANGPPICNLIAPLVDSPLQDGYCLADMWFANRLHILCAIYVQLNTLTFWPWEILST